MYTLENHADDKRFEEYLLIKQQIEKLSKNIQTVLLKLLDYCYVEKEDLMVILRFTKKNLEA